MTEIRSNVARGLGSDATRTWRALSLGLAALFLAACGLGRPLVRVPETLSDADLALGFAQGKNRDSGDFAEQVVIRGKLSDGGLFYAKLQVSNLANTDGRASVNVDVKLGDGRKATYSEKKEKGDWRWDSGRLYAQVGDATFEVKVGEAHVVVDGPDFAVDVRVTSKMPAIRPAGGLFDSGGAFYVTTIPIPRGKLEGTLEVRTPLKRPEPEPKPEASTDVTVEAETPEEGEPDESVPDDEKLIELEGTGFADHRAGNLPPYLLAHAWYNILNIDEDRTVVMSAFEPVRKTAENGTVTKKPVRGWIFAANDDELVLYEPVIDVWAQGIARDQPTGYELPQIVRVADPGHASFKGVIVTGPLSERKDDLANLKKLERIVVKQFMKPWTFRFDQARFLFRKQPVGEPSFEVRGAERFQYQQLKE